MKDLFFSDEVQQALDSGQPLVALESTIIAHGMPWPDNLETAQALEREVRENGAIPATIALLNGQIKVGLSQDELYRLATQKDVKKISRRDLAFAVAMKQHGATTVSATMLIAQRAGIRIFATGGIGGVHRGVQHSFDVSADLTELGQTPVAVVCAGAKSILDLPKTLEYLETQGVPVIGYGTDYFPAFFMHSSGLPVACRLNSPDEVAQMLRASDRLALGQGCVIANPIPLAHEPEMKLLEKAIQLALQEAEQQNIKGKATTPFLLKRIHEITEGKSVRANIRLVANNARLAAQIAACYHSA